MPWEWWKKTQSCLAILNSAKVKVGFENNYLNLSNIELRLTKKSDFYKNSTKWMDGKIEIKLLHFTQLSTPFFKLIRKDNYLVTRLQF